MGTPVENVLAMLKAILGPEDYASVCQLSTTEG
jgi:hypothetical protein